MSKGLGICVLVVGIVVSIFSVLSVYTVMAYSSLAGYPDQSAAIVVVMFVVGLGIVLIIGGLLLIKRAKRGGVESPSKTKLGGLP